MSRSQLPGWSGESGHEDPNWPDQAAQKRVLLLGRLIGGGLLGLIPAICLRDFHPFAVWLVASLLLYWFIGLCVKSYTGEV